jgi:serine/threonine protein kinase
MFFEKYSSILHPLLTKSCNSADRSIQIHPARLAKPISTTSRRHTTSTIHLRVSSFARAPTNLFNSAPTMASSRSSRRTSTITPLSKRKSRPSSSGTKPKPQVVIKSEPLLVPLLPSDSYITPGHSSSPDSEADHGADPGNEGSEEQLQNENQAPRMSLDLHAAGIATPKPSQSRNFITPRAPLATMTSIHDGNKRKRGADEEMGSPRSSPPPMADLAASVDLGPGAKLGGRYTVVRIAGRGQFSVVYTALDETASTVAIKRYHPQWTVVGQQEAAVLAPYRESRHIVNLHDHFLDGQNYCLVMEHMDGHFVSPACLCGSHPVPACQDRTYRIAQHIVAVLSGLQELHARDIIHADLTPGNIMIKGPYTKIIDLGNAIAPEQRHVYDGEYDVTSGCYRAPEMLLGVGRVGRHVDLWSAGIIFVELLLQGSDVFVPGGIDGAELMRSPCEGRYEHVRRLIEVFGNIDCLSGGVYWEQSYHDLGTNWGWNREQGKVPRGAKVGLLWGVLQQARVTEGLLGLLVGLLQIRPESRLSTEEAMTDGWLIREVFGVAAEVLLARAWRETVRNGVSETPMPQRNGVSETPVPIRRDSQPQPIFNHNGRSDTPLPMSQQRKMEDIALGSGTVDDEDDEEVDLVYS